MGFTRRRERGFSLMELMIVLSILLVVGAISVVSSQPVLRNIRVDNAYNTVMETTRRAREQAVAERRTYFVTYTAPRTISITQAATGTVTNTITLPYDIQFNNEPGIPTAANKVPDGFGVGAQAFDLDIGVAGGNGNPVYFYPDGSAHDLNGFTNNGVIYMARSGDLMSARALSIYGTSGRLKGWRLDQNVNGKFWRQQ